MDWLDCSKDKLEADQARRDGLEKDQLFLLEARKDLQLSVNFIDKGREEVDAASTLDKDEKAEGLSMLLFERVNSNCWVYEA